MKRTNKQKFLLSIATLMLCAVMLMGTTFAWFTDTASVNVNKIVSGTLDVDLEVNIGSEEAPEWVSCTDENSAYKVLSFVDKDDNVYWEPGCTYTLQPLRVVNEGNLALKFKVLVTGIKGNAKLNEAIEWTVTVDGKDYAIDDEHHLDADAEPLEILVKGHMKEEAGNEYQDLTIDGISVTVYATQDTVEYDSNGNTYDLNAEYPKVENYVDVNATGEVNVTTENNVTTEEATFSGNGVNVTVPAGVAVDTDVLGVAVTSKNQTNTNITVNENERVSSYDVHVDGVASNNTTPIIVEMGSILPKNLNSTAVKLYHVENGTPVAMTYVASNAEFTLHNQFKYDPATGNVTVAMASFSEVIALNDTTNAWDGTTVDKSWFAAKANEQIIRNAEQLAGFAQLVTDGNSFNGYTVKLAADINLGGDIYTENNSETVKNIFYPIGAWSNKGGIKSFKGTFDGMGHTISNLAQRGWNMTESEFVSTLSQDITPNTLGLFASLEDATVKNLGVDGFKIKMEYSTMGAVAGMVSGNCTFENIAVTNADMWSCNTAVAGIAGWDVGESSVLTFKNITVDSTNTFHALWGVYDTVTSGILGYLSGDSSARFDNCNVSCVLDIYNDFCGNYMWGIYRYCGMFIGAVANTTEPDTNGRKYADLSNVTAKGCTVNFGDWHDDYYYCEFVKNGHPSYAGEDDYKFSRVPLSEIVFVDGVATGCTHTHTDAEDGRAYNFIFDAVFGSYGNWGVKPVDLEKYNNIHINDITKYITETEKNESEPKFTAATGNITVSNNQAYPVTDFFTAIEGANIDTANVVVSYSDVNNSGVYVKFDKNTDWTQSTVEFEGMGTVKLTIQDYDFCEPTEILLNVVFLYNDFENGTINGWTEHRGDTDRLSVKTENENSYLFFDRTTTPNQPYAAVRRIGAIEAGYTYKASLRVFVEPNDSVTDESAQVQIETYLSTDGPDSASIVHRTTSIPYYTWTTIEFEGAAAEAYSNGSLCVRFNWAQDNPKTLMIDDVLITYTEPQPAGEIVVVNKTIDFENGNTNGWTGNNTVTIVELDGDNALYYSERVDRWARVGYNVGSLSAGEEYVFSCDLFAYSDQKDANITDESKHISYRILLNDGLWGSTYHSKNFVVTPDAWGKVSINYTPSTDLSNVHFVIDTEPYGESKPSFYVDNFNVKNAGYQSSETIFDGNIVFDWADYSGNIEALKDGFNMNGYWPCVFDDGNTFSAFKNALMQDEAKLIIKYKGGDRVGASLWRWGALAHEYSNKATEIVTDEDGYKYAIFDANAVTAMFANWREIHGTDDPVGFAIQGYTAGDLAYGIYVTVPAQKHIYLAEDFADGNANGWAWDGSVNVVDGVAQFENRYNTYASIRHTLSDGARTFLTAGNTYTVEAEVYATPTGEVTYRKDDEATPDIDESTLIDYGNMAIDGKVTLHMFVTIPAIDGVQDEIKFSKNVTVDVETWTKMTLEITIPEGTINLENAIIGINSEGHGDWRNNPSFYVDNIFVGDKGATNPLPTNVVTAE